MADTTVTANTIERHDFRDGIGPDAPLFAIEWERETWTHECAAVDNGTSGGDFTGLLYTVTHDDDLSVCGWIESTRLPSDEYLYSTICGNGEYGSLALRDVEEFLIDGHLRHELPEYRLPDRPIMSYARQWHEE